MKTKYYNPDNHIKDLTKDSFYRNLILLRNLVSLSCDAYFQKLNSPKVDLFLITQGVSSPTGKGSDSVPIPFEFGSKHAYLVDSAQFGMEPLVQKSFDMVYCYLPSFRGEDPDDRHLNQFFHCEAELRGKLEDAMNIAEGLVKSICGKVLESYDKNVFSFKKNNFGEIKKGLNRKFKIVTFDEAEDILTKKGFGKLIEQHDFGRVLTREGEIKLAEILSKDNTPFWVIKYDRDTVAFYQKPDPDNINKVLNADLIFPSINGGFGGEILGCGQRQDNKNELITSMKRQNVRNNGNYDWYLDLRLNSGYKSTAGFGMGIERLIAWMLGLPSIVDCILYPVLKDHVNTI